MTKKSTLIIAMFLIVLNSIIAAVPVVAQDDEYRGMKGTERPQYQDSSETEKCFVFSKYVVKTIEIDDVAEKISVYKRRAGTAAKSACRTAGEAYANLNDFDSTFFYGLSGSLLFIDSGTSVESRDLEIYDLDSRKSVFNESYTNDPALIGGRFVSFDSPSDKKGPVRTCKEAAKWKRDGGGVGWVQGKKLDLQTFRLVDVGTLRCIYMQ